jgi:DNA repair protein RecN (Recombination protein N)
MLRELGVQHLALIEDVRVELDTGFCAWTGETGAGKSLLLGAIGLLLGERGIAELLRSGEDELRVTGRFELTRPEQKQAAEELLQTSITDEELILTRRLARSGRSSALVNEQPVSVATLRKLGEMLVDVHGQRESYSLLQPSYQLELLDAFGKLTDQRTAYQAQAEVVRGHRSRAKLLMEQRQTRQRELSLLRFEREELGAAGLVAGEMAALQQEREKLLNSRGLAEFAGGAADALMDGEGAMADTLARLLKHANNWSKYDNELSLVAKRIETLKPEVQDLARTCRTLADSYEADPERLEAVERRLQLLKKLEGKYHRTIDELVEYLATLTEREQTLQAEEDDLATINTQLDGAFAKLSDIAVSLSKGRAKVAKKLAAEAEKHLVQLQMANAKLTAELTTTPLDPTADIPTDGADHLELMLMANPGEPARPLRKVASGGELSRTTLALKTVLAAHDPVRTLVVFDEIDANVGGRLCDVLGQMLAKLGLSHQVLCVTHLPQVAAYATRQWTIRKTTTGKRTSTTITLLEPEQKRIEELALMLRGEARTETTLKEAAEMLKNARKAAKRG